MFLYKTSLPIGVGFLLVLFQEPSPPGSLWWISGFPLSSDGLHEMSSGTQCLFAFSSHLEKKNTIIIDCFEIFIERHSNLLARSTKHFRACHTGNTTDKLVDMFRENWKNSTYWLDDQVLCSPYKSFAICCFFWVSRSTQREYSSKTLKHSIVKRILVFKRKI